MEQDIRHNHRGDQNNPLVSAADIRGNNQRTRIEVRRAIRDADEIWERRPLHEPVDFYDAPHYATIINDERSSPFDWRDDNMAEIRAVRVTEPDGLARVRDIFRAIENGRR